MLSFEPSFDHFNLLKVKWLVFDDTSAAMTPFSMYSTGLHKPPAQRGSAAVSGEVSKMSHVSSQVSQVSATRLTLSDHAIVKFVKVALAKI